MVGGVRLEGGRVFLNSQSRRGRSGAGRDDYGEAIPFKFQTTIPAAVIAPLDRAIQYSRDAGVLAEKPLEYWMPRFRGA
jgi:hypothetical protein